LNYVVVRVEGGRVTSSLR